MTHMRCCVPLHEHGAPHHEFPHHDAKRIHVARSVQPPLPRHLRCSVERRALVDAALVRVVALEAQGETKVSDLDVKVCIPDRAAHAVLAAVLYTPQHECHDAYDVLARCISFCFLGEQRSPQQLWKQLSPKQLRTAAVNSGMLQRHSPQ